MKARVIKSVSFNASDPIELSMLAHLTKFSSFSVYVKRLIQRDMDGSYAPPKATQTYQQTPEFDDDKIDYESFT
ncbi:hypothetical protein AB1282_25510 [Gottfriedia sp. S16(2024)]|uniref:hypothetical protein n=1 Tax=Gottfriedia sp. S16(2024) TaxID=3162883 RepID=UPI003D1F9FA4